jgi:hypothetical protein
MKKLLTEWRKYLKESYSLVGNCKDFDEDGYCMISELPYSDATEFAQAEENASEMSAQDFQAAVGDVLTVPEPYYMYDEENDVYMLYDAAEDVHYFYVRDR